MEGATADHARQVIAGSPIYGLPTLAFTPFMYSPLYYVVSAIVAQIFGIGLHAILRGHHEEKKQTITGEPPPKRWGMVWAFGLLAVSLIQFLTLWYNPAAQIPTAADDRAGDILIDP